MGIIIEYTIEMIKVDGFGEIEVGAMEKSECCDSLHDNNDSERRTTCTSGIVFRRKMGGGTNALSPTHVIAQMSTRSRIKREGRHRYVEAQIQKEMMGTRGMNR